MKITTNVISNYNNKVTIATINIQPIARRKLNSLPKRKPRPKLNPRPRIPNGKLSMAFYR